MSTFGFFQPAVLGMESQSYALAAIATNVSNISTGGYKRTDVNFATVLSQTVSSQDADGPAPAGTSQSDLGGVRPVDSQRVSLQGLVQATDRELDVAINGRGFFVLNTQTDGSGETLFGRDGRFSLTVSADSDVSIENGYLVDKNGYYVQGYTADADGNAAIGESGLETVFLPPDLLSSGSPTTEAALALNLPADTLAGESQSYVIDAYDSSGQRRDYQLSFTRTDTPNVWSFDVTGGTGDVIDLAPYTQTVITTDAAQQSVFDSVAGTVQIQDAVSGLPLTGAFAGLSAGEQITATDTTGSDGVYTIAAVSADQSTLTIAAATPLPADETVATPVTYAGPAALDPITFGADGYVDSPDAYSFTVTHADGATSAFTLDISGFTQFGDEFLPYTWDRDGAPPGELESLEFNSEGYLIGVFDNDVKTPLYRLAIADFINPDGLSARSGNVYTTGVDSGAPEYGAAGDDDLGLLIPSAHELSNVDLAQEFTRMTMTQAAYNASATSFRTIDEMTQVARDLSA